MRRTAAALFVTLTCVASAGAQEVTASVSLYAPFGLDDLDGELPPSAELRFSQHLSERFAIEPFVTIGSHRRRASVTEGFYGAQVRQRIVNVSGPADYLFATYGVAGYYQRYRSPFESEFDVCPPIIGHIGFGLHQRVAERLAIRPEAQLVTFTILPIGMRLLAGLAVDLDP